MTIISTGMNGPVYQFTSTPMTFGPWHQIVHGDTAPHHVHLGHNMYYLNYSSIYNPIRPQHFHPYHIRNK